MRKDNPKNWEKTNKKGELHRRNAGSKVREEMREEEREGGGGVKQKAEGEIKIERRLQRNGEKTRRRGGRRVQNKKKGGGGGDKWH